MLSHALKTMHNYSKAFIQSTICLCSLLSHVPSAASDNELLAKHLRRKDTCILIKRLFSTTVDMEFKQALLQSVMAQNSCAFNEAKAYVMPDEIDLASYFIGALERERGKRSGSAFADDNGFYGQWVETIDIMLEYRSTQGDKDLNLAWSTFFCAVPEMSGAITTWKRGGANPDTLLTLGFGQGVRGTARQFLKDRCPSMLNLLD